MSGTHEFVVVANRLPVDIRTDADGEISWTTSPGGLVTALAPVMQSQDGAWVGWSGSADQSLDPFEADGMQLVPVPLSAKEVTEYYEGFSNATLWPLYHDVIVEPQFHRIWWNSYVEVNKRFAEAAAGVAAQSATVWVQDYQLQLVPEMLRRLRPDVRIGFFDHIPFPPVELFGQLPWRQRVIEGLLGADVIGFQRTGDAANFLRAVRRFTDHGTRGQRITIGQHWNRPERHVRVGTFPISIDSAKVDALARTEQIEQRAAQLRAELGDPDVLMLGVDRLDYTKGIRHRIKAFGELVAEKKMTVPRTALVQVASPSREQVEQYKTLRQEVEVMVGNINGDHGSWGRSAIYYMHHSYPFEEMVALFRAADVMLVTALRDGMNLVAKEYVAARPDLGGVLVLSEFAGAADELGQALLVNPHDIEGMKAAMIKAATMAPAEKRRRMRTLRKRVLENDVQGWAQKFLAVLQNMPQRSTHV
ncbi:alpha,alpha-trehalose-phosphate synthase (UDP-forming) [Ruania halotolerans]|uniref:alpha,alpha-trehalose-phosphate synthase (UDP-forming) n=1 Tax=Ruania halotolerans TaxID=2897773 RepID=UPI001E37F58F|nr:trehalose-6-phosphate synthase [Ruania halotolerans]UFU07206.1 trehalose-6-phosphate synthase [Ruania halotolerans]